MSDYSWAKPTPGAVGLALLRKIADAGPGGLAEGDEQLRLGEEEMIGTLAEFRLIERKGGPSRLFLTPAGEQALREADAQS